MHVLVEIALKSLLISGLTLIALLLLKSRSAAERSWVAHIGLLGLVVMAFAPLVLPTWTVETPAFLQSSEQQPITALAPTSAVRPKSDALPPSPVHRPTATAASSRPSLGPAAAATAIYAVPAAILLFITLLALTRLIALRARADVLVDGHWLSALARAQRRMGFKHGTALLTSNELASPISWGLMRPVILLNSRAVEATGEAEAIIAHELAHVARMDWVKLLLARVATALFWFNPLVWLLAREAHQLREEAADDSVLAADISDTDYAQLLVGVARHECPGLLLGAHGVAPSKSSLARRVARVLDGKSVRGPVARSFAVGVFAGAILVAAPLAALTLAPPGAKEAKPAVTPLAVSEPISSHLQTPEEPTDLAHIIATGVSTSVTTATAAIAAHGAVSPDDFYAKAPSGATVRSSNGVTIAEAPNGATVRTQKGMTVARAQNGASVTVYPPDSTGRRRVVAVAPNGATAVSYEDAADAYLPKSGTHYRDEAIDSAIEMKALGVTPEYAAAIRSASPALRGITVDQILELRAVGVTPQYVQEIASAGFRNLGLDAIKEARTVGLSADYMRAIRATGVRPTIDQLVELRAMGVRPDDLARVHEILGRRARSSRPPNPPEPPLPPGTDGDGG